MKPQLGDTISNRYVLVSPLREETGLQEGQRPCARTGLPAVYCQQQQGIAGSQRNRFHAGYFA